MGEEFRAARRPARGPARGDPTQAVDSGSWPLPATAHYHGGGEIHIGAQRVGNSRVHYHEFGHHAHYEAYDINGGVSWPATDCPDPHRFGEASATTCPFREGWAHFFSGTVVHSNRLWLGRFGQEVENDPDMIAQFRDLEARQCEPFPCGWAPGGLVEGNVASLFWDVVDTATDDGADGMDEALGDLWDILLVEDVQSLEDYWENWCGERTVSDCDEFEDLANHDTIFFATSTESQLLRTALDIPLGTVLNLLPVALELILTDTGVELLDELMTALLFEDNI